MGLSHNRMNLSHNRMNLSHNRMNLSYNRMSLSHNRMSLSHNRMNLSHNRMSLSNDIRQLWRSILKQPITFIQKQFQHSCPCHQCARLFFQTKHHSAKCFGINRKLDSPDSNPHTSFQSTHI